MGRYKNHMMLGFVTLVVAGLLMTDTQLSKPLLVAAQIVASFTVLFAVVFAVAWRVHKRKQSAAISKFDDVR